GLPGNETPPGRHSALLAQVKREQSSCGQPAWEHPGPQVPEHQCEAVKRAASVPG
ncbi:hypothetical protein N324_02895, partial [Chlamydotis macqueenii]